MENNNNLNIYKKRPYFMIGFLVSWVFGIINFSLSFNFSVDTPTSLIIARIILITLIQLVIVSGLVYLIILAIKKSDNKKNINSLVNNNFQKAFKKAISGISTQIILGFIGSLPLLIFSLACRAGGGC